MNIKSVFLAATLTITVILGSTYAQGTVNYGSPAAQFDAVGYSTVSGGSYFGYPSAGAVDYATDGCSGCGGSQGACNACGGYGGYGQGNGYEWRQKLEHHKEQNAKVCARNRVWPKPFDCADRQLYFSIWEPMLDAGYEKHCTLTSAHFDEETQALNNYGKSAVAGIMQNMPEHRKTVFIHRDIDQNISDSRMNEVRNAIETWYGSTTKASIAFTDNLPTRINGDRIEVINGLYREGTPPPTIPVASGNGGVGSN